MATHAVPGSTAGCSQRGERFYDRVKSNAGVGERRREEPCLGNDPIEASHRSARWVRVVGKRFAVRLKGSEEARLEVLFGVYGVPDGASSAGEGFYIQLRSSTFMGGSMPKPLRILKKAQS